MRYQDAYKFKFVFFFLKKSTKKSVNRYNFFWNPLYFDCLMAAPNKATYVSILCDRWPDLLSQRLCLLVEVISYLSAHIIAQTYEYSNIVYIR